MEIAIVIPVVKKYGFKVYKEQFDKNIVGKLLVGTGVKDLYNSNNVTLVNGDDHVFK